ncbi:shTK domain protein [Ostertagia ostertagi]
MFFYILCALFLLNAFTAEAQKEEPCEDEGGEQFCFGPKNAGLCDSPGFAKVAEQMCAKTCGLCE